MAIQAGVYCYQNKVNGKRYIGSTKNLTERHNQHVARLHRGNSQHPKLQYAWNKYGEDSFEYSVLQLLPKTFTRKERVKVENIWIAYYDCVNNGYNCSTADGYGKEVRAKPFKLMSPDGAIYEGTNIREFALEHGLNPALLNHVVNGKRISHKRWTLVNPRKSKCIKTKFRLRSPSGNIVEGEYLAKLCREEGLDQNTMTAVLSGKIKQHKGWSNADREDIDPIYTKEFTIVSPSGEVITGRNISKFAKANGLAAQGLQQLIKGKVLVSQGYRLPENAHIVKPPKIEKFILRSPDGEIVEIDCLADFTRGTNLNPDYLSRVFRGEVRYYKRWSRIDDDPAPLERALPSNTLKIRILNPQGELIESESLAKLCRAYRITPKCISQVMKGEKESHKGWRLPA